MFPKRKLEESRNGGESVTEETGVNEDQLQQNKRPRVESSPVRPGTWSPLLTEQLPTRSLNALVRVKKNTRNFCSIGFLTLEREKKV